MRITFLGTSGSMPTPERGSSSIVIMKDRQVIMLDCGEGTQRQMVKAGIGFQRSMRIFITYLHGDHVLGLPGLLQSMSLLRREKELHIYGPVGITEFVKAFSESIGAPSFPVLLYEIQEPGIVHEEEDYIVEAVKANHSNTAWSFGVFETPRPGKFYPKRQRSWGSLREETGIVCSTEILWRLTEKHSPQIWSQTRRAREEGWYIVETQVQLMS